MKKRASRMTPIREYFKFKECYWRSAQTIHDVEARCAYYDAIINMGLCNELPDEDNMPDDAYHAWMDQKWRLTTSVQNHLNGKKNTPKTVDMDTGEITEDDNDTGQVAQGLASQSAMSETASDTISGRTSETQRVSNPTNPQAQPTKGVPDSVTGRLRNPETGLFIDE